MTDKTAAELAAEERNKITVVTTADKPEEKEVKKGEAETKEVETAKTEEKEVTETVAENKEEIEETKDKEKELKEDIKNAETEAERNKFQKRLDREVAKRKTLEEENAALKKQLEEKPTEEKLTDAEVERRANEKAAIKDAEREFTRACNRLADAGAKADEQFTTKLDDMASDIGPIPGRMIGILDDLDNGADVLVHLFKDHDEALKIYSMQPEKMAMALTKISNSLVKKPEVKPVSKVPKPNEPLGGSSKSGTPINDTMSTKEWIERRNAEMAAKGKR